MSISISKQDKSKHKGERRNEHRNKRNVLATVGPLQELGLSVGAEHAYRKLVESGPKLIADLSRLCGQFRTDTYRYVSELEENNLIHKVLQGKRTYYEAASPDSIFSILKMKEDKIADQVTDLLSLFDRRQKGFSPETFSGKKGIAAAFELLLKNAKKNAEIYRIESPRNHRIIGKYYPKLYWKRSSSRQNGDIQKYVITNQATFLARRRTLNRSSKPVPAKHSPFIFEFSSIIIEDKVCFVDYELEKAIIIRDKRFSSFMRTIFLMLYEKL